MKDRRLYLDYLKDMAAHAGKAIRFVGARGLETFAKNEEKVFAVVRALEVMGEAAKHVPDDFRGEHSEIPWREVSGMRDKVIHEYFNVDVEVVWRTAKEDFRNSGETSTGY